MFFKRGIALFLLTCILLCLPGCKGKPQNGGESALSSQPQGSTQNTLSLFYCANDSINPYLATTNTNRQLSWLLYDPLVRLNANYETEYVLAQSVVLTDAHCVVNLKEASFSDGTLLTAEDVIYSLELAKKSSTKYAEQLADVSTVTAVDGKCVSIMLKSQPRLCRYVGFSDY